MSQLHFLLVNITLEYFVGVRILCFATSAHSVQDVNHNLLDPEKQDFVLCIGKYLCVYIHTNNKLIH